MCQGLTKSAGGLYACRFIMGIFEGGVAPGAALLMGQYYRRAEFAPRYAIFVCSALLGSAFSSVSSNVVSPSSQS
jgi:MFS family permease